MEGRVVRGPWDGDPRYVVERVGEEDTVPGVPAGAYLYADPERRPTPGVLVLAEHCGRRTVERFVAGLDPRAGTVIGVVVAAVIDLVAS